MRKKANLKSALTIAVVLLSVLSGSVWATGTYDDGDGSPGNPFQINTPAQMDEIGQHSEDWASYFVLTADISLAGYTGTAFNIIGSSGTRFLGSFDGNDHTISNFSYTTTGTSDIGLFGYVGSDGQIKNLGLVDVLVDVDVDAGKGHFVGGLVGINDGTVSNCYATGTITATGDAIGGLVGRNDYGTVSNCYATGNVTGDSGVGGLVGDNWENGGTVSNCYATGTVTGGEWGVGGLVGYNYHGTVSNCYATGDVTGTGDDVGGLVGQSYDGTVSNCYATGDVTGGDDWVGGLVGFNPWGPVSNCYATGTVTATGDQVGGLVGSSSGPVSNCYATGDVTGTGNVGGLVGYNYYSTVSNCYAAGAVSGTSNVGGQVGIDDSGSYTSCFWDETVNSGLTGVGNITDPAEVMGRTTAQMQTESTFTDYGWDFVNIWDICEETNYPKLVWQIPAGDFICPDGVNFIDFAYFVPTWQSEPGDWNWNPICDISDPNDNTINGLDLGVFIDHWLQGI